MSENVVLFKLHYTVTDEYKLQLNSYDKLCCRPQYQVLHLVVQNFQTWSSDFYFIYSTQIQHRPITACMIVIKYIKVTSKVIGHLGHDTLPLSHWFCFQRTVVPSPTCTSLTGPLNLPASHELVTLHLDVCLYILSGILLKPLDPLRWRHYGPLKCWELITQQCPKRREDSKILLYV